MVTEEARLVAQAICAVITVVDPDLVVLGGGCLSAGTELAWGQLMSGSYRR